MSDQILDSNVIRVVRDGPVWLATIGPDSRIGLMASGPTPELAVLALVDKLLSISWPWDEGWRHCYPTLELVE